jgi:hypothetical protein
MARRDKVTEQNEYFPAKMSPQWRSSVEAIVDFFHFSAPENRPWYCPIAGGSSQSLNLLLRSLSHTHEPDSKGGGIPEQQYNIILTRGSHISVYNALLTTSLRPYYTLPGSHTLTNLPLPDSELSVAKAVKKVWQENKIVHFLLLMGTTYDGFLINLEPIRKWMQTDEFREKNKGFSPPIILDMAWSAKSIAMKVCEGAFTKQMQHCDGWLTSIHKTLPSSYTSSILVFHHKYATGIAKDFFSRFISSLNATWQRSCSTSFRPWIFQELGKLGYAFNPKSTWRKGWEADLDRIKEFQEILKRGFETFGAAVVLLCDEHIQQYPSISAMCPWRINIYFDAEKIGFSGIEFASRLEQEGIVVVEKATQFTVLALPPIGFSSKFTKKEELEDFAQLWINVLRDLSQSQSSKQQFVATETPAPKIAKVPSEAFKDARMMISLEDSEGRIAGNAIAPYPPGVPIIASGEIISPAHVAAIRAAVSNHILFKTKLYYPADALVFSGVDDIKVEVLI